MKKITTIFFLTIYLFSTTEAHQLLKLPVVFQHFNEHKKEDKNLSLIQFLAIHYLHGSPRDKDYDRDMQLPFKTACVGVAIVSTAIVHLKFSIERPVNISTAQDFIAPDQFILSSYLSNIWQPPKSC